MRERRMKAGRYKKEEEARKRGKIYERGNIRTEKKDERKEGKGGKTNH